MQEIHSWPDVPVKQELKVLGWLLKILEAEQDFETCTIVHNRMETLRAKNNPKSTYQ
jgi:hypothetical protein